MKDVEEDRESEIRSAVCSILPRTRYSPDPVIVSKRRRRNRGGRLFSWGTRDATWFSGGYSDLVPYRIWPDRTSLQHRSHVWPSGPAR
jgi:beta-mannanase